jgi:hypothetical protein
MRDRRGLAVHTSAEAAESYDRALDHLVRFEVEMVPACVDAVTSDPDFALGHAMNAYMALLSTDGGATRAARDRFQAARFDESVLDPRERAHLKAARRWLGGDLLGAGDVLASLAIEHPRDLLALAVGHQIDFFVGNARSLRDRIGRSLSSWSAEEPDYGFLLGMYAFGLEESNLYGRAQEAGHRALEANSDDVWAIHAVVHTFEMQGHIAEGIRFMREREASWAEGNFLNVHNSWHFALFALQGDDVTRALEIYDRVLLPVGEDDMALHLLDATSLLWRLHLDGLGVGDRWGPLADAWSATLTPGLYPFNDMHAAMAYVGAGRHRALEELLEELEAVAAAHDRADTGAYLTATVGLSVCRAFRAYGDDDHRAVVAELMDVRGRLHAFGGSHAQRDAVERTLLLSAIAAGDRDLAAALLSERLALNEQSSWSWAARARAADVLGDGVTAEASRSRAAALAARARTALDP